MLNVARVARGAQAAYVSGAAGVIALVLLVLFFVIGGPFGTLNDIALLVAVVALQPMMLAHYELGGIVPLWPARLSLAGATAAVAGYALLQLAFIAGLVDFDYEQPATGALAVQTLFLAVIGLWVAGASALAGRWLPMLARGLGILAGVSTLLAAIGLLQGGMTSVVGWAGAPGYLVGLPLWALALGRVFAEQAGSGPSVVEATASA
jgi:hypothetical protein